MVGLAVIVVVVEGATACQDPICNTYGLKYWTYSSNDTDSLVLLLLLLLLMLDKQFPTQSNSTFNYKIRKISPQ